MRCFIALPCPSEIRERLAVIQEKIKDFDGIKLVEFENIHLTLKFLGEVPDDKVESISNALGFLEQENKFEVKVKGLGAFPKLSHINVVWAGVEDRTRIDSLHASVDKKLAELDFQSENRFHPHYTIARVKYVKDKNSIQKFITENMDTKFGSYTMEKVVFMKSELTPQGPIYSPIMQYNLV